MASGGFGSRWNEGSQVIHAPSKGGFGARYNATASQASAPKKRGGGFLHALGHIASQTVTDLRDAAVNAPGGVYHTAGAYVHDIKKNPELAFVLPGYAAYATATGKGQVGKIGRGMISSTVHDFEHPLRHPGNTLLDALAYGGVAGGAIARAGEAGRALRAGESVGRAVLKGPKPEPRYVTSPSTGAKVEAGTYAKAASTRAVQKGLDKLREKYPDVHFGLRNQAGRVGHAMDTNARYEESLRRAPNAHLQAIGKKLNQAQRDAIRVVAEEVPLGQRIAHAKEMLQDAPTPRIKNNVKAYLTRMERAQQHVHDVQGVPRFKPDQSRLIQAYEKSKELADKTERDLVDAKVLDAKGATERKAMPGEVIRGDLHARHGFNPDLVPETFGPSDKGFFVSYKHQPIPGSISRPARLGAPESIGIPRKPSQLTHEFSGASIRHGEVPDTLQSVGNHYLQVSRFLRLWHQRGELEKLMKPVKETKHDIPVRPFWMKQGWPEDVRAQMHNLDQPLQPEEQANLTQRLHDSMFPKESTLKPEDFENGKVQWIDKRELGSINRPGPLAGASANPLFKGSLKFVDAVNQAEKTATIYLRVGHVLTRGANNFVFNLVQQGFLAPRNLARASRMSAKLSDDAFHNIVSGVHEGYFGSLGNVGIGKALTGKVQGFYEHRVDLPFRLSSFVHEAAREGYKKWNDVERLATDPKLHDTFLRVQQRANNEIIDYGRLGPVERDFIRRIVFIYPWMKGATIYAGKFLGEHPVQAGVYGQLGKQQAERNQRELGPLPSYLQGIFKTGGSSQMPTVVNPKVINQFGTSADVLEALKGAITGHPEKAYQLREFLMPAYAAAAGENSTSKGPKGLKGFLEGLYNQTPEYLLAQRLHHPPSKASFPHIYPYTPREALLQFFAGSVSPHTMNRERANVAAYKEKHPRP